jgi:small-conductance mechanosensitive channel
MEWRALVDYQLWGNSLQAWAASVALVVVVTTGLRLISRFALTRVTSFAERTTTDLDNLAVELLGKTRTLAVLLVAVWAAARPLELSDGAESFLRAVLVIGILLQAGFWGMGLTNYVVQRWRRQQIMHDPGMATAVGALGFIAKLGLWAVLSITALANMGVDITAFVASLGIGGIAVALALQNVLGDLFASLSIVLDKPFVIGDFVVVDDLQGTVEHVGLKTTRIRSLSGEQIVFSNSDLLSSRVRNFKRMQERRIVFPVGVTYDTPASKLRAIPGIIEEAVGAQERARFDRSHFKAFGDFSLDFETVYYVTVPDYAAYMDVQQEVNLALVDAFSQDGIEFAFPTQTLHLVHDPVHATEGSDGPVSEGGTAPDRA